MTEAIGRRLDHLSQECQSMLRVAAVVGREFDHALLLEAGKFGDVQLLDLVDEALGASVIEEVEGGYQFTHALLQRGSRSQHVPAIGCNDLGIDVPTAAVHGQSRHAQAPHVCAGFAGSAQA